MPRLTGIGKREWEVTFDGKVPAGVKPAAQTVALNVSQGELTADANERSGRIEPGDCRLRSAWRVSIFARMNNEASVPAASASPVIEPPVITMFESGKEKTGQPWTLTLHPTHLTLADAPGVQPYVILRDQLMKTAVLHEGIRCFAVEQPRRIIFKLSAADVPKLAAWIGVPFLCHFFLRRRFGMILPWACLWILGGLVSLLPTSDDRPGPGFQIASIVWGLVLIGAWALARWRPHPGLFLVDAVWFNWVGINLGLSVWHGRSRWWLLLVVLLFWMGMTGFRHFFRFRGVRLSADTGKIL